MHSRLGLLFDMLNPITVGRLIASEGEQSNTGCEKLNAVESGAEFLQTARRKRRQVH